MPQAIPAIASISVAAAGYETAAMVIGFIGSIAMGALQREIADDDTGDMTQALRVNARNPSASVPVVYGKIRIGGNDVFIEPAGSDNKDLWIVQTFSEGECESIAQVDSVDQLWLGEKLHNEFGGNVSYWFHNGSNTQIYDTNINSAISKFDDNMRYTCYIVWKLHFDTDYFQSLPNRTALLKGVKLYDFRDSSTAWSANPVLELYDYLTNNRYGYGFDSSRIDTTSWISAANYCDMQGWESHLKITEQIAGQKTLDNLCSLFRGQLVWYDGKFYLRYADTNEESIAMNLNDSHIAQADDGKMQISISEPSDFSKPDALRVRYVDEGNGYVENSIIIGDRIGVVKEVALTGCTNREHAANIGVYMLERMRLDRTITGTFHDEAIKLEPHDLVNLIASPLGISDQLMRVVDAVINPDKSINLTLQYEDSILYDDNYNLDIEGVYECSLPDPTEIPPGVENVSISESLYSYRGRTFTALNIAFDAPSDYTWYSYVEVWLSFDGSTWEHQFNSTTDFELPNVKEDDEYWIRLKTVSIHGRKTPDNSDYKIYYIVGGRTIAPDSLDELNAVVNSNSVNLYSSKVSDTDVEHYEFRLGGSWNSGIFLAALRAPNMSLYGVKPGIHSFWCNTLANNGVYGDIPRSTTVTLIDPPQGWAVQNIETCDYNGIGTHDNTEYIIYDSDDYLKCSHGGSPVSYTGTYTSPIYDLGSLGEYLIYLSADIVVTGTGTTWDDVIPSGATWEEINIDSRSWTQIFELSEGVVVKIRLLHGETSPPTATVKKMELLGTVITGRYFQIEIEIQDPSDSINALVENFELKFCQ